MSVVVSAPKLLLDTNAGRFENWASALEEMLRQVRVPASSVDGPGEDVKTMVPRVLMRGARESLAGDVSLWGPFRSEEEQKVAQRELIAFELSLVLKAGSQGGYNIRKHPTDFNDSWLCAYPAAGYTIVTEDLRLKKALTMAGCPEPRVLDLEEGLVLAESWLRSFERTQSDNSGT